MNKQDKRLIAAAKRISDCVNFDEVVEVISKALGRPCHSIREIGGRGGRIGFTMTTLCQAFDDTRFMALEARGLSYAGAYCNYLGGGIRGAVCKTVTFPPGLPREEDGIGQAIKAICDKCHDLYPGEEREALGFDEESKAGEPNWEELGTQAARNAGIESAY